MAGNKPANKTGHEKDKTAYWQQPWVQCVLRGKYSRLEQLLFMRMASFGKNGCNMKNDTLMEELGCKRSTLIQGITNLWDGGELIITSWNGHQRRIFAAKNPEAKAALNEWFDRYKTAGIVKDMPGFLKKIRLRSHITVQKLGR